jgi:cell division protein DivIC
MPQLNHAASHEPNNVRDKGARRRIRLVGMIMLCFAVWAGLSSFKQAEFVRGKKEQLAQMEAKLAAVAEKNERLKLEITRLNDPEYIEQIAKKDLQMIRPGETLFTEPEAAQ